MTQVSWWEIWRIRRMLDQECTRSLKNYSQTGHFILAHDSGAESKNRSSTNPNFFLFPSVAWYFPVVFLITVRPSYAHSNLITALLLMFYLMWWHLWVCLVLPWAVPWCQAKCSSSCYFFPEWSLWKPFLQHFCHEYWDDLSVQFQYFFWKFPVSSTSPQSWEICIQKLVNGT